MCGICGFLSKNKVTYNQLKDMNDTMYHRGPNDSGEELVEAKSGYTVGLAQRRLSILDLSMLGHQPMHSCNDRLVITYNGEIYNFLELKEELKDYPFQSNCDTEVILAAYMKWGIQCINKFNGMFAIAIWDKELQTLFLVRDRIGKKPLYYWMNNNELVFASELKPIMNYPTMEKEIRKDIMKRYLYQQYISQPDTIFEHVYKVEPGQVITIRIADDGNLYKEAEKYWDISKIYHEKKVEKVGDYTEAKNELKSILKEAVRKRMIADVPLGTFLSGGYDSSLVSAIAQEISDEPIKTYSIGFYEEKYNEAKYAKEVANYLGTHHTEMYIDEKNMFELVDSIPTYFDEPFADSSQIPSMLVSKLAAQDVTVVLSGDGGDELFCGYNMYDYMEKARKLDVFGSIIYKVCHIPGISKLNCVEKLPFQIQAIVDNRDKETKTQFGGNNYIRAVNQLVLAEGIPCKYDIEQKYQESNWQKRRMLLDEEIYLPGDILCKVDRSSMKYSIESRCPILDVNVIEYSYKLPHDYKYNNGVKKRILKDIAYDYIPRELLDRKKVGFAVPLDQWMRGPLKEQLQEYIQPEFLKKQCIFDDKYVSQFMQMYFDAGDKGSGSGENYSRIVWAFYVFQQWYQKYMK